MDAAAFKVVNNPVFSVGETVQGRRNTHTHACTFAEYMQLLSCQQEHNRVPRGEKTYRRATANNPVKREDTITRGECHTGIFQHA